MNEKVNINVTGIQNIITTRKDPVKVINRVVADKPVKIGLPEIRFIKPQANITVDKNIFGISTQTKNVKAWQDVTVTINGTSTTNFSFSNEGMVTTNIGLKEGANRIEVSGKNESGVTTERTTITYNKPYNEPVIIEPPVVVVEPKPCPKPIINFNMIAINQADATHELKGTVSNVRSQSDIRFTINGKTFTSFQYTPGTGALHALVKLQTGVNTINVTASNSCGQDSGSKTIRIDEEKACGPRINPGNSTWQFCLVTPSGIINRDNLTNSNFSYSGSASSLFFLPIAGGGDVVVNGKPYSIRPGQYYLFKGNLKVTVNTKNPGSMGHWSVCIITDQVPVFGNGNNRPKSPCEEVRDKNNRK